MKHAHQVIAVLLLTSLAAVVLSAPALAMKPLLDRTRKVYALDKALAKCTLCHEIDESKKEEPEGHNLDEFGKDVENQPLMKLLLHKDDDYKYSEAELKQLEQVLRVLEAIDSDKDGATNLEELELGTFPGRKASTPSREALQDYRKTKK